MSITPFPSQGQYPWYDQLEQWGADTQSAAESAELNADGLRADVATALSDSTAASAAAIAAAGLVGAPAGTAVKAAIEPGGAANQSAQALSAVVAGQDVFRPLLDALRPESTLQIYQEFASQQFRVSSVHNGRHVSWVMGGTAPDAYRPLSMIYSGSCEDYLKEIEYLGFQEVTQIGVWQGAAPSTRYVTDIGAGFEVPVKIEADGENVILLTYRDNRGGVWQVELLGSNLAPVKVSTWAATAGVVATTVFYKLMRGSYVLKATFLGADPDNEPTGGVARGWATVDDVTTPSRALVTRQDTFQVTSLTNLLSPMSNREFAFRIRPQGSSMGHIWVPEHESTPSTVEVSPPKYFIDGKPFDATSVLPNMYFKAESFTVIQEVYGKIPGVAENLMKISTTTTFKGDGSATVSGRWEALEDLEMNTSYVAMLPGSGTFDTVTTGFGQRIANGPEKYGTSTYLENDLSTEYAFTSSANPSRALFMQIHAAGQTINPFSPLKAAPDYRTFVEHRSGSVLKVYNRMAEINANVPKGTAGYFSATWTAYDWTPIAQAV